MESQTQLTPTPQVPSQSNKIKVLVSVIILLLASALYFLYLDNVQEKRSQELMLTFSVDMNNNRYQEVYQLLNTLVDQRLGRHLVKTQTQLDQIVTKRIQEITEDIIEEKDTAFSTYHKVEEIRILRNYSGAEEAFNREIEKRTNQFLNDKTSFAELDYLFENIQMLGFATDVLEKNKVIAQQCLKSRDNTKQGLALAEKGDHLGALQKFVQVSDEDQHNYQIAQQSLTLSLNKLYATVDRRGKLGQYDFALNLLNELKSILPKEQSIAEKITALETARQEDEKNLVPYHGQVQHIFFHPLIAFPELTFDGDLQSRGFNEWFVTVPEFKKMIASIYAKGFILVDFDDVYEVKKQDGKDIVAAKPLYLPKGKRPMIMSIDDLNYYRYMIKNGTVHKLIVDHEGKIATYSKGVKGEEIISYDNEIIPILDRFVEEHPDFSFRGAKGVIALTGYEGILGYRTDFDSPNHNEERKQVLNVVQTLKDNGWAFASHGYGHLNTREDTYERIVRDTQKWKSEVESLIGHTDIYIYPFGASVKLEDPKFKVLQDAGFTVFCSVGPNPDLKFSRHFILTERRHIDGIALFWQANSYRDLYESEQIIDPVRPVLTR